MRRAWGGPLLVLRNTDIVDAGGGGIVGMSPSIVGRAPRRHTAAGEHHVNRRRVARPAAPAPRAPLLHELHRVRRKDLSAAPSIERLEVGRATPCSSWGNGARAGGPRPHRRPGAGHRPVRTARRRSRGSTSPTCGSQMAGRAGGSATAAGNRRLRVADDHLGGRMGGLFSSLGAVLPLRQRPDPASRPASGPARRDPRRPRPRRFVVLPKLPNMVIAPAEARRRAVRQDRPHRYPRTLAQQQGPLAAAVALDPSSSPRPRTAWPWRKDAEPRPHQRGRRGSHDNSAGASASSAARQSLRNEQIAPRRGHSNAARPCSAEARPTPSW